MIVCRESSDSGALLKLREGIARLRETVVGATVSAIMWTFIRVTQRYAHCQKQKQQQQPATLSDDLVDSWAVTWTCSDKRFDSCRSRSVMQTLCHPPLQTHDARTQLS